MTHGPWARAAPSRQRFVRGSMNRRKCGSVAVWRCADVAVWQRGNVAVWQGVRVCGDASDPRVSSLECSGCGSVWDGTGMDWKGMEEHGMAWHGMTPGR
jgi:hypothetical protein